MLAAWRALRRDIDPLIAQGGGRIFKSLGDGLLVEFTSPVEATRTALAVQAAAGQACAPRARRAPETALRHPHGRGHRRRHRPVGRRHQHRVAPAAACADRRRAGVGGGHGPDQRPHRRADRGPGAAEARNISRPVHAYMRGRRASGRARRRRSTASSGGGRRSPCCRSSTSPRTADGETAGTATSYFSDGLVEDIIAALSCLPELVVISRTSMLRYRGAAPDPRQVRRELGVRYMLSGSVRRAGDKVRLSAELADCESGTHDLERPLRRRGGRPLRAAGRAFGPGGGDDHAAGAGSRAAPRAAQAAGEPRRLRMRAARARPALPLRGRPLHRRRCRCSSAPWRSIRTMRRRMRWRRAGTACASTRARRPTPSPTTRRPTG